MRQLVQSLRSGEVEVVDVPAPSARSNEVLVRTRWSLISPGTEQAIARTANRGLVGKALDRPDQVRKVADKLLRDGVGPTVSAVRARLDDFLTPGYSSMGVVQAVGPGVTGLRRGDRVGCVGANIACHAEYVAVPAPLCLLLPDDLDDRWGAFGALGAIAAHGVRIAESSAGETVAVIGLGLVGQLAAQIVTAGGGRVIAIDRDASRVVLARELGAVAGSTPDPDAAEQVTLGVTDGRGADAVVVAAAGDDSGPIELAARIARDRAVVSVVGDVGLDVPRRPFFERELTLRVSRSYGPGRYDPSYEEDGHDYPIGFVRWTQRRLIAYIFEEVAAGRIRLDPLVTHEFGIEEGVEAYGALQSAGRMGILLRYPDSAEPPTASPAPAAMPMRKTAARSSGRPRVGLIGPGLFARSTLLPLLQAADADLTVIAGGRGPTALSASRRFGARPASNAGEVLDDPEVDLVVIATRHDSHAELAAQALDRGKAVFVEKPLAIDRAGLERLRPHLEGGAPLVVDFNRRFAPATLALRAELGQRRDPIHVTYRVNAGALPQEHWLRDPAVGGGRLVGEGCHFVDFCLAVVGSRVTQIAVAALPAGPITVAEDSFVLTLFHADGSLSTIAYVATGSPRMSKERVEILGAGRSLVIEDFRRVRRYRGRPERPVLAQDKGHTAILEATLRAVASGGPFPIPPPEILATTEACLTARSALQAGSTGPVACGS